MLLVYVLYNLFKNALHAIKAAGRGEVDITLATRQLLVTDTGSGIPADILPVYRSPSVQVLTLYNGMPASSVEVDITSRMERWTGQAAAPSSNRARAR